MNFIIEKVLERDIDLLMINKFIYDKKVLDLFLNKIDKKDYSIISVQHSLTDQEDGESDITVIVEKENYKIGLLIEDKINASATENQGERYESRGNKGIINHQYNEFYVFMIAPKEYLNTNEEAKNYPYRISYEELLEIMKDDIYANTLFSKAIEEKKNGYIIIENEAVTLFWEKLYALIRKEYNKIKINEVHGPRGNDACWPDFATDYPNVRIIQKSNRGYLDLTFSKMGNHPNIFHKYVDNILKKDMSVERTQKSMAIRINIPIIDFRGEFDNQIKNVKTSLNQTLRLYKILNKINVNDMYKEIENKNADIKSLSDFKRLYPSGIIVNYDKRCTYRSSTEKLETIASSVDYPYVQRYQSGTNPRTDLFIIKDNMLQKINRIEVGNPNSNYYIDDINITVSEEFYKDKEFLSKTNNPVNIIPEELLEIIDIER